MLFAVSVTLFGRSRTMDALVNAVSLSIWPTFGIPEGADPYRFTWERETVVYSLNECLARQPRPPVVVDPQVEKERKLRAEIEELRGMISDLKEIFLITAMVKTTKEGDF
jgi:hypothetical protein